MHCGAGPARRPTDSGSRPPDAAVVARAGRVRRRRAAVAGGAAMAGLIAAAVFVIGPGSDSVVTTPADQTDGPAPTSVDSSVDTTAPGPTHRSETEPDQDVTVTTTPTDHVAGPDDHGAVGDTADRNGVVDDRAIDERTSRAGTTVVAPPPTSPPPTTPTTTAAPAPDPVTQTYSSAGGSITVRWDGVALSLLDVTPAAGFDSEVEDDRPDRIRVRFQGDGDFRIEIRVEDGEIVRVE